MKTVISIILAISISGCGTIASMNPPYAACGAVTPPDRAYVDAMESVVRADMFNGWTYDQEMFGVTEGCYGFSWECDRCGHAVVNFVYGR